MIKSKKLEKKGSPKKKEAEKILIGVVDDNAQVAISIAQLLEYNGYATYQAYNGIDAIELTKEKKPALLLLDIKMNMMSGYEVAKKLANQKILFMTGFEVEQDKVKKE
jgi:two-component system response regulator (stage 0 sporulation protein F)